MTVSPPLVTFQPGGSPAWALWSGAVYGCNFAVAVVGEGDCAFASTATQRTEHKQSKTVIQNGRISLLRMCTLLADGNPGGVSETKSSGSRGRFAIRCAKPIMPSNAEANRKSPVNSLPIEIQIKWS